MKPIKTLGYGYRLSSETVNEVFGYYVTEGSSALHKTIKEVKNAIAHDIETGIISKQSKPRIFRVKAEEL